MAIPIAPRAGSFVMKDLREYAKQTNVRLAVGAFVLLFVVGVGLIWLIYGGNAAGMGFICLLAALFPVVLILLIFLAIEWILKRARPK
jgi:multisubunit Na+/H+ antiporter MnhB subunit